MYGTIIQTSDKKYLNIRSGRYSIILGAIKCCLLVILVQVDTVKVLRCMLI